MKVPWLRPLRLAALSVLGRPLVLAYHRIAKAGFDPWSLCVAPERFEQHLQILGRRKAVLPLAELAERARAGRAPRHAVAITFDDGYADNLHCARPILEAYGMPATFFLTTWNIVQQREYWWDELGRILVETPDLPAELTVAMADGEERRPVPDGSEGRIRLYRALWARLRALDHDERERRLGELAAWAGLDRAPRESHRPLRADEAVELGRDGRMTIGAHTRTHPALPGLAPARQEEEIGGGKAELEALLGKVVTTFSYPYGAHGPETVAIVRRSGFACACITMPGALWRATDPHRLPRLVVDDWDGTAFSHCLALSG